LSLKLIIARYRDRLAFRFLGLRFAPQPERFSYAQSYDEPGPNGGLEYGSRCTQNPQKNELTNSSGTEDCLFLNVFTPFLPGKLSYDKSKLRPVMFYIHGGSFEAGRGSDPTFDGGNLASRGDVVVVTINYRLSTLGFLALNDGVTKGNYGLADQVLALDWVRARITTFGGDPDRITIFGQSAGSASVRALLASPKTVGKFAGTIQMSTPSGLGKSGPYTKYQTQTEEISKVTIPILNLTGCANASSQLNCLRSYDPHKLVNLSTVASYPIVDGNYLTSDGLQFNVSKPYVPTIMGTMRDDGAYFATYYNNKTLVEALSEGGIPGSLLVATGLFPLPGGSNYSLDVFNVTARVVTDGYFSCLDQATAASATKHKSFKNLWYYQFDRSYQPEDNPPYHPICDATKDATHPNGDPSQEYFK
jgi:carboxylesterase type B